MQSEAAPGWSLLTSSAVASKEAEHALPSSQTASNLQRSKDETAEEKRRRKQLVKEARVSAAHILWTASRT